MRDWFVLFLLTTLLFGWAQVGICWLFCEVVAGDQKFFWPFMGIPMSFNLCVSFVWAGSIWSERENK